MVGYLPKEVREGLDAARKKNARKQKRKLRLDVGGVTFSVLRYWQDGVSVRADRAPHVRGLADIYEGQSHIAQCLIVASSEAFGEMVYEFKRNTAALDQPPADFVRDEDRAVGLLPNLT